MLTNSGLSRIEERLWPAGASLDVWMVADGARDRRVVWALRDSHLRHSCLYSGPLAPELEFTAPYLVRFDHQDAGTRSFLSQAWGNNWGVFLKADESMERLRRHLREFLIVRDSHGSRLVFRYYDPRVLKVYLPTCTADELRTVFGPIERFWMEDEDPRAGLEFRLDEMRLLRQTFPVGEADTGPSA
jgi:hypothetical protein